LCSELKAKVTYSVCKLNNANSSMEHALIFNLHPHHPHHELHRAHLKRQPATAVHGEVLKLFTTAKAGSCFIYQTTRHTAICHIRAVAFSTQSTTSSQLVLFNLQVK